MGKEESLSPRGDLLSAIQICNPLIRPLYISNVSDCSNLPLPNHTRSIFLNPGSDILPHSQHKVQKSLKSDFFVPKRCERAEVVDSDRASCEGMSGAWAEDLVLQHSKTERLQI